MAFTDLEEFISEHLDFKTPHQLFEQDQVILERWLKEKQRLKERYQANKKLYRIAWRKWFLAHKAQWYQYQKAWRQKNRARHTASRRRYYKKYKARILANKRAEYARKHPGCIPRKSPDRTKLKTVKVRKERPSYKKLVEFTCPVCSKIAFKTYGQIYRNQKIAKHSGPFCSRTCGGKFHWMNKEKKAA